MLAGDVLVRAVAATFMAGLGGGFVAAYRGAPDLRVTARGDRLVVRFRGWDLIWAWRRQLSIPLGQVAGISVVAVERLGSAWPLWGTIVPGLMCVGTMRTGGGTREFWNVRRASHVIQVELTARAPYHRVLLEVPEPGELLRRLRPVLGSWTPALL